MNHVSTMIRIWATALAGTSAAISRLSMMLAVMHAECRFTLGPCHLLGINFMPRLKDLADQRLWRVHNCQIPDALASLFVGNADAAAITEQWDQLVCIAASLKAGIASAHVVLQRLTAAGPSDRIAKALTALGRLVKPSNILHHLPMSRCVYASRPNSTAARPVTAWPGGCSSPTRASSAPPISR